MKLNRATLPEQKSQTFTEELDFSKQTFDENHVKRIESCSVTVVATEFGDVMQCVISGKAHVVASCSYTLEDVPLDVKFHDSFYFTDSKDDEAEDCYYEPNVEIDLDPHILALILAEVPHNIVKNGAKLPKSGNGYRVLSEEDFIKENKNGFLLERNDVDGMEEAMRILMSDENLRKIMGDNNRQQANIFKIEHVFQQWENVVNKVVNR